MIPKEERCKAKVPNGGRSVSFHQCTRRAVKDGYCKIHHPDTERKKKAKQHTIWDLEYKINHLNWALTDFAWDCLKLIKKYATEDIHKEALKLIDKIGETEKKLKEERKKLEEMKR